MQELCIKSTPHQPPTHHPTKKKQQYQTKFETFHKTHNYNYK